VELEGAKTSGAGTMMDERRSSPEHRADNDDAMDDAIDQAQDALDDLVDILPGEQGDCKTWIVVNVDGAKVMPEKEAYMNHVGMKPFCTVLKGEEEEEDGWVKLLEEKGYMQIRKKDGKIFVKQVDPRSLYIFPIRNCGRMAVIRIVESRWFDRFILGCILVNSILLAVYQMRATRDQDHWIINHLIDTVFDDILWSVFTCETILKIIAFGVCCGPRTGYLRDPWNILDFIVVLSGLFERTAGGTGLGFLRLFRLLRPLRSLNAVPEMKILVKTVMSAFLKLGNVSLLFVFLVMLFGITGISLMNGVFYRQCYVTPNPQLIETGGEFCWEWIPTGEERLCGGNYMCLNGGHCKGYEDDPVPEFAPEFAGGRRDYPFCENSQSAMTKVFPETDFVHFDHLGGAFLLIFQSMTLEGWTEIMYMVEDGFSPAFAANIYFFAVVFLTNYFMLNVALAVVDEVQDDEDEKHRYAKQLFELEYFPGEEWKHVLERRLQFLGKMNALADNTLQVLDSTETCEEPYLIQDIMNKESPYYKDLDSDSFPLHIMDGQDLIDELEAESSQGEDPTRWMDCKLVHICSAIKENECFNNFILLMIVGNVANMCIGDFVLDYPDTFSFSSSPFGNTTKKHVTSILEILFLAIFSAEMIIVIIAMGPKGYVKSFKDAFDGFVVVISLVEMLLPILMGDGGGNSALSALRTFRLFRLMNKIAAKVPRIKVQLKAMVSTFRALGYWLVLFVLMIYIFTLMWIQVYATTFHFKDPDSLAELEEATYDDPEDPRSRWCEGTYVSGLHTSFRRDCIPRANFDTFGWGVVTIFQVMTGENWNTIMYAGMRSSEWEALPSSLSQTLSAMLFVVLIWLGQILILSVFLSTLINKFHKVQIEYEESEKKLARSKSHPQRSAVLSDMLTKFKGQSSRKVAPAIMEDSSSPTRGTSSETMSEVARAASSSDLRRTGEGGEMSTDSLPQTKSGNVRGKDSPTKSPSRKKEPEPEKERRPDGWPVGYAFFILSEKNPIRQAARWLLTVECVFTNDHSLLVRPKEDKVKLSKRAFVVVEDDDLVSVDKVKGHEDGMIDCGLHGTVLKVDEDGDALIHFVMPKEDKRKTHKQHHPEEPLHKYGVGKHWIARSDFPKLACRDVNDEFRLVKLGRDQGYTSTFYCGKQLVEEIVPGTDGSNCGPDSGPQCAACKRFQIRHAELEGKKSLIKVNFDNIILLCIILSTCCMIANTPLSDPKNWSTKLILEADRVFAFIFILEMVVKLIAQGLIHGPNAYLKSGWNWLDGIVVMVSIVDIALADQAQMGFLRVLRVLRTFRPLRMISRNEGLKGVINTLLKSMQDLIILVSVALLFMLIFALIGLMYLRGQMYQCSPGDDADVGYLRDLGSFTKNNMGFTTPLCIGDDVLQGSVPKGSYHTWIAMSPEFSYAATPDDVPWWVRREGPTQTIYGNWSMGTCESPNAYDYRRPTADTPICLARCSTNYEEHPEGIRHLCSRKYTKPQELPPSPNCPAGRVPTWSTVEEEAVGERYVADMTRTLVVPCGGSMLNDAGDEVINVGANISCRQNFCPNGGTRDEALCEEECSETDSFFCADTCKWFNDAACRACRNECVAACTCQEFCSPLIKDAALCVEQGGSWGQMVSQNFDSVVSSMYTLFEMMTTEGWVDVMYAAADKVDYYVQPQRDYFVYRASIYSILWMLISWMFLMNLAVGVVVEKFFELKKEAADEKLKKEGPGKKRSDLQSKLIDGRKALLARPYIYDLPNLHELKEPRKRVYDLISSKAFERFIMGAIVVNTIIMACTAFPEPTPWWRQAQEFLSYFFAAIYTVEAILKLIALQFNYWWDWWNKFDFLCVIATLMGIILKQPPFNVDLGSVAQVIRILRIARLIRLLRFLKELNRLFQCLFISIRKLCYVGVVQVLFLVLFSVLGNQLFATSKFTEDSTLNVHGNFWTFFRGFVTLFRASTGEAWNEIMHDLAKSERDWFNEGMWCTPRSLFDTSNAETWEVLNDKCLIPTSDNLNHHPNSCPQHPLFSYLFWPVYTIIITFVIVNLVVAVILEAYEEGKVNEETDNIDICIEVWKKYDKNHRMELPLKDALMFVNEALQKIGAPALPDLKGSTLDDLRLPIKTSTWSARALDMEVMANNMVTHTSAFLQVLRLAVLKGVITPERLRELETGSINEVCTVKELKKIQNPRRKHQVETKDLAKTLAVRRLQQRWRNRKAEREARAQREVRAQLSMREAWSKPSPTEKSKEGTEVKEGKDEGKAADPSAEADQPTNSIDPAPEGDPVVQVPPRAG
jgi:hypothetical protein